MPESFYQKTGSLVSPGDLLAPLPYSRVPKPLKVARKISRTLPKSFSIQGELREVLEVGKHDPTPKFSFDPPGEEIISRAQMATAIFLTWGSEVDDDKRGGGLQRKHWLIAPIFPLANLEIEISDSRAGGTIQLAAAIRGGQSPRYFPLPAFPGEESKGFYVDFRKICPLSATYFDDLPRPWRLGPQALNDFYHHLIWFFTRRKIFFGPIACPKCQAPVDLGVIFEGQPLDPEQPNNP